MLTTQGQRCVDAVLGHHTVDGRTKTSLDTCLDAIADAVATIDVEFSESTRERSLVYTHLEEASMWLQRVAHAAQEAQRTQSLRVVGKSDRNGMG